MSTGKSAHVAEAGDYRIFAGWRSDPFFFDTEGTLNNLQFTGVDFFTNGDVCSIVIEVPTSTLGPNPIGLWHRTVDGASGTIGFRPTEVLVLRKLSSFPATREMLTSPRHRRTMPVSSLSLRTHWST